MKNENHDGNWLTQGSPGKNGVYICMCTCVSVCRHEEKYRAKFKKKICSRNENLHSTRKNENEVNILTNKMLRLIKSNT